MTNISKTIIFFGTSQFSVPTLRALIDGGYSIGAVITKPDQPVGRGHRVLPPIIKKIATDHNIPVLQPQKVADIADDLKTFSNPVGVLVSYGKIIPQSIIDLFDPGIINVHPSRLPKYRGPTPIESAIMNGDTSTSISIMLLTAGMDEGPVYGYSDIPLSGHETQASLYEQASEIGAVTLCELLPAILNQEIQAVPQDNQAATYTRLLTKADSLLDPTTLTAQEAERKVRAHIVFPKTKITLLGQEIIITKAHVSEKAVSDIDIRCKDDTVLTIDELVAANGRRMTGKAFLNGYAAGA